MRSPSLPNGQGVAVYRAKGREGELPAAVGAKDKEPSATEGALEEGILRGGGHRHGALGRQEGCDRPRQHDACV